MTSIDKIYEVLQEMKKEVESSSIPDGDVGLVAAVATALQLREEMSGGYSEASASLSFPETFFEWAKSYNIKSHAHQFLAAAAYLRQQNQTVIQTDNIMKLYGEARWKKPANPTDVILKAAAKGFFTEATTDRDDPNAKKSWQLTRTGYDELQALKEPDDD